VRRTQLEKESLVSKIGFEKAIHNVLPPDLEDEELVARSRTGDVGAFRGIATRYYSLIPQAVIGSRR
jgi:hypothetical protein